MGRNSLIKSVSIPDVWASFLDENPDLSLSKILQAKLIEIKQNREIFQGRFLKQINQLKRKADYLEKKVFMLGNFLEEKKLWAEFNAFSRQ